MIKIMVKYDYFWLKLNDNLVIILDIIIRIILFWLFYIL